jgi:hypothetical protein
MTSAAGGRTPECTPERIDALVDAVRAGMKRYLPFNRALAKVGISERTYYHWRKKWQGDEEPYATQVAKVEAVRGELEERLAHRLGRLAKRGTKNDSVRFAATKYMLERHYPERWGAAQRVELTGKNGEPIQTESVARVVILPPLDDEPNTGSNLAAEPGPTDHVPGEQRS